MRIALIDHYDSFTFNVIDWLERNIPQLEIVHVYFDDLAAIEGLRLGKMPLVLSPGPCHPADAKSTLALVKEVLGKVPILGVCLGHQILGLCSGAEIASALQPFHGSTTAVSLESNKIFTGFSETIEVAIYHSLVVQEPLLEPGWEVIARNNDGEVMGLCWEDAKAPAFGLQFHPESFMSQGGAILAKNFARILKEWNETLQASQASAMAPFSMPS